MESAKSQTEEPRKCLNGRNFLQIQALAFALLFGKCRIIASQILDGCLGKTLLSIEKIHPGDSGENKKERHKKYVFFGSLALKIVPLSL